jgi:HSP20 family protein
MADNEKTTVPVPAAEQRLRRVGPFDMMATMRDEMARLWPWATHPLAERAGAGMPRMDVYEQDHTLVIKAELPGVEKADLEVSLDHGDLVIRGERKAEQEVKEQDYYRMERSFGSFYRRLPLGFAVTPEQIEAHCTDGVLEIRIPEPTAAQPAPQKIPIA